MTTRRKLTINVDAATAREARAAAILAGTTITAVVEEALREYVRKSKSKGRE
jgi:hypothetical protein